MAWLGEKRKTEFSWSQANQAMSESRIFEQKPHFLQYLFVSAKTKYRQQTFKMKMARRRQGKMPLDKTRDKSAWRHEHAAGKKKNQLKLWEYFLFNLNDFCPSGKSFLFPSLNIIKTL